MLNYAVIDLRKIKSNAKKIKKMLPKNSKFCAVVKANAYGHGAETVASYIYKTVDCFAVAIAEEGVALRLSGIKKPILVLTPIEKSDVKKAIDYNLTITIASKKNLQEVIKEAKLKGGKISAHIKYNTGMNRNGFDTLMDLRQAIVMSKKSKVIEIEGLYSHLSNPENKKKTREAINKFLLANKLIKGYNNNAICHISASGGFLQGYYFDMVRIGILLYGYKPYKSDKIKVSPAMKVYAPVIAKRQIQAFSGALYGNKKTLTKKNVTLIRFGYADGLGRKRIKGEINNRCMDISAETEDKNTKSKLKRVNKKNMYPVMTDAEELAKKYKTISYEILTSVSNRAERIYKR